MQITAGMVKELRERTGAGMMDCKKALLEAGGNIESAIEAMRRSGTAKAARKAGRVAAEGVIVLKENRAANEAILAEINCETDFVAKDESFLAFANAVAATALATHAEHVETLLRASMTDGSGLGVEESRQQLVAKLGENITVRRFSRMHSLGGRIGSYVHGNRIGVLVDVDGGDDELARDVAMQVAASRPVCITEAEVPAALLEQERRIYQAQAAASGKPPEIVEKMVLGRLARFVKEITLLGQPFIKDPDRSVGRLLKSKGAKVSRFVRLEVGEGIEKKAGDFASEVIAQAGLQNR
ncbi:MAG: elongation factor Ts [Gammaproteobacteria bacterium]|nr:elongation factor Ts [Gammaproteobacteria bacterium]